MSAANYPFLITDGFKNEDKTTEDEYAAYLSVPEKITDTVTVKKRIKMLSTVTNAYETLGFFKEFDILSKKIGLGEEAQIQNKMNFLESCLGDAA
mmetsp:Transcript_50576/g.50941  ORF Transcript_50576/g.50941 Transcript_50576/m.50941 type:complete len:95 (-) Transcript_50576:70-354(-)